MNTTAYVLLGCIGALILAGGVLAELNHRAHQAERRRKNGE